MNVTKEDKKEIKKDLATIDTLIAEVTGAALDGRDTSEAARNYAVLIEEAGRETPVVIVDIDEIYLKVPKEEFKNKRLQDLKEGEYVKGKRICGKPRTKDNRHLRCLNSAGFKTLHLGVGRCVYHDRAGNNSLTLLAGLEKKGYALKVFEMFELYPEMMNDDSITGLNEEIVIARLKLMEAIENDDDIAIQKYLDSISKLKVNKSKIEIDRLTIDKKSLGHFVGSIFKIIKDELPNEQYSKVALALKDKLRFPINKDIREFMASNTPATEDIENDVVGEAEEIKVIDIETIEASGEDIENTSEDQVP